MHSKVVSKVGALQRCSLDWSLHHFVSLFISRLKAKYFDVGSLSWPNTHVCNKCQQCSRYCNKCDLFWQVIYNTFNWIWYPNSIKRKYDHNFN